LGKVKNKKKSTKASKTSSAAKKKTGARTTKKKAVATKRPGKSNPSSKPLAEPTPRGKPGTPRGADKPGGELSDTADREPASGVKGLSHAPQKDRQERVAEKRLLSFNVYFFSIIIGLALVSFSFFFEPEFVNPKRTLRIAKGYLHPKPPNSNTNDQPYKQRAESYIYPWPATPQPEGGESQGIKPSPINQTDTKHTPPLVSEGTNQPLKSTERSLELLDLEKTNGNSRTTEPYAGPENEEH